MAERSLRLAIRLILEDHFEVEDEIDQAYDEFVELLGEPWAQKQVAELPNEPEPSPGVRPMELSNVRDAPPLGDLWRTMILLRGKEDINHMRWVVSQATVDEIERQSDANLARDRAYRAHPDPPGTPLTYFDRPVRIDESAEGVTYEVLGHAYTSTACRHGLHDRCRRTCKFCDARCQCDCHPRGDES